MPGHFKDGKDKTGRMEPKREREREGENAAKKG